MTGLTGVCQHQLACLLSVFITDRFQHMLLPTDDRFWTPAFNGNPVDDLVVDYRAADRHNKQGLGFRNRVTLPEMEALRLRLGLELTVWTPDGFSRRHTFKQVWGNAAPEILTFIPDAAWHRAKNWESFVSVGNLIWTDPETGDDAGNTYMGVFLHYKAPKAKTKKGKKKKSRERPVRDISYSKRLDVLLRDNKTCQICGCTEGPLHVDHKMPVSRGGTNDMDNLWTLCAPCNLGKSDRVITSLL